MKLVSKTPGDEFLDQFPISCQTAMMNMQDFLSIHEKTEIEEFEEIYYMARND